MKSELKEIFDLMDNAVSLGQTAEMLSDLSTKTRKQANKMLADFAKQNNYTKDQYDRYHIDLGDRVMEFKIQSREGYAYDIRQFPLNKQE